jgi:hypothetical protein
VARTVRCSAAPTLALMVWNFLMAGTRVTVRVNAWVAVRSCSWRSGSAGTPRQRS